MEITHQGYNYKCFSLPARSTISEYYPDKSIKSPIQPSVDLLQISDNILFISNRLEHLQTSLAKISLLTFSNNNIHNNIINNNNTNSDSTLRVFESTTTSSMNQFMQLRVAKKSKSKPTIPQSLSIPSTPSLFVLSDSDRQEIEALQPSSHKIKPLLLPHLQSQIV